MIVKLHFQMLGSLKLTLCYTLKVTFPLHLSNWCKRMAILQKVKFTQEKVKNFGRKSYVHFLENKLFFPGKMEQIFTLKVLVLGCRALDFTHANGFQVFCTHGMPKTWADAGPLNVKYLVNAVYFIRKLRGNGLIFLKFCRVPSDPWRESFLMMVSSLCLSFHETVPLTAETLGGLISKKMG